jgi:predicted nucleic acid-binding protein
VIPPYAYVDTSALMKLVVAEPESRALENHLAHRAGLVSSSLAATEVTRAFRRALSKKQLTQVDEVLRALVLMDVTPAILARAAELAPPQLRTLDAIHLATALSANDTALDFITYDVRLAKAAKAHGFTVVAP